MPSLTENTRRLLFCGVAFAAGVSLFTYVISKFLMLTPLMRSSFTGWALIFVAIVLLVGCLVYAVLGVGFGFRLSDTLTEDDGHVVWRFGFDTSLGGHENRFALLRNGNGLWIVRARPNKASAGSLQDVK